MVLREKKRFKSPFVNLETEIRDLLNYLTNDSPKRILALAQNLTLEWCNIRGNKLESFNNSSVKKLSIYYMSKNMLPDFDVLRSFVCSFSGIETLSFGGINFGDADFEAFCNLIFDLPLLKTCHISFSTHKLLLDGTKNSWFSWILQLTYGLVLSKNKKIYVLLDSATRTWIVELSPEALYKHLLEKPESMIPLVNLVSKKIRSEYWVEKRLSETRLIFVGGGRTGKTSTINNIVGNSFSHNVRSTLLLDLKYLLELQIGSFQSWKITTRHQVSLNRLYQHLPQISLTKFSEHLSEKSVYLKQDLKKSLKLPFESDMITEVMHSSSFIRKLIFGETTYIEELRYVQVYDFGGQTSFESVHKLFLSSFGVYCVVFDSSRFSKKQQQVLLFWFRSVVTYAPSAPIFILGTHFQRAKQKHGDYCLEWQNNIVERIVIAAGAQDVLRKCEKYDFFTIENSIRAPNFDIFYLRYKLEEFLIDKNSKFKARYTKSLLFGQILFMDHLRQAFTHITLGEFYRIARNSNFEKEEIGSMLAAYSHSGLILYIPQLCGSMGNLNVVVFSPAWLGTALSKFIHDPEIHKFAVNVSKKQFIDYREFIHTGFLSLPLFMDVLKSYKMFDIYFFQMLCEAFLILLKGHAEDSRSGYYASKMVPQVSEKSSLIQENKASSKYMSYIEKNLSEELFLVFCLYWVRAAVELKCKEEPIIYRNLVRVVYSVNEIVTIRLFDAEDMIEVELDGKFDMQWIDSLYWEAVKELKLKKRLLQRCLNY
eukprot:snap_masked-scaffold_23-processed-gene-5.36-mRNA-1 protein AED:1.00 eAED:1.00 QI:0/0/0/0/1/1/6/0/764